MRLSTLKGDNYEKTTTKKPKKEWSKKEHEVFFYFNDNGKKLWGFRLRYYDALKNRREKSKQGLTSENIAIRALLEIKTNLINGDVKRVDNTTLTISEWMDIWFAEHKRNWAISTCVRRQGIIKDQIKPLLGKYRLLDLDRSTYINEFINVLVKSYETSSVENYHNIFRIAINAAVENETLPRNRFTRIPIAGKEENQSLENFLTAGQLKEFLLFAKKQRKYNKLFGNDTTCVYRSAKR